MNVESKVKQAVIGFILMVAAVIFAAVALVTGKGLDTRLVQGAIVLLFLIGLVTLLDAWGVNRVLMMGKKKEEK